MVLSTRTSPDRPSLRRGNQLFQKATLLLPTLLIFYHNRQDVLCNVMHEGAGWHMLKVDLHGTCTGLDPAFYVHLFLSVFTTAARHPVLKYGVFGPNSVLCQPRFLNEMQEHMPHSVDMQSANPSSLSHLPSFRTSNSLTNMKQLPWPVLRGLVDFGTRPDSFSCAYALREGGGDRSFCGACQLDSAFPCSLSDGFSGPMG